MANLLSIAQSALNAAQVGMSTTGHNIANASTPGFSRQVLTQGTQSPQNAGFGYLGKGTQVESVRRVYNEYLSNQVVSSQSSHNELSSYYSQIAPLNNLFADSTVGLSPSMQEFFQGVQALSTDPSSGGARQSMLSSAETLAAQFQSLDGRLDELRQGVNAQIATSVGTINSYAQQIATLNDAIGKAMAGAEGKPANDLLDQRDFLISELSKEIQVSVTKQGTDYAVYIGNGQPLVVGTKPYDLVTKASATDPGRSMVAYKNGGTVVTLAENALSGGKLGGLFEFRSKTLDPAQSSLGRVAVGLATAFNTQHRLGQDQTGALGGDFFKVGGPMVFASTLNTSNTQIGAKISNPNALTGSDYQLEYVGPANYRVTRMSDGQITTATGLPTTVDGVDFNINSGVPVAGDTFMIRPTANAAAGFSVAITDKTKIAAAAPVRTAALSANTGAGKIGPATVGSTAILSAVSLTYDSTGPSLTGFPAGLPITVKSGVTTTTYPAGTAAVPYLAGDTVTFGGVQVSGIPTVNGSYNVGPPTSTLTYTTATNTLAGFPNYLDVTVTNNGTSTTYAAGTPVPYTAGATISYGGVSFTLSGVLANNDKFTVGPNTNGVGDNRNAVLLASVQTAKLLGGNTETFQGAFGNMINAIGNKTHELEVTSTAQGKLLDQAITLQQAESGVNLDEEATNLLKYQQAYQAAGKVMQTASRMFDILMSIAD